MARMKTLMWFLFGCAALVCLFRGDPWGAVGMLFVAALLSPLFVDRHK